MRASVERSRELLTKEFSQAGAELDATPTEHQKAVADELGLSLRILHLLGIELTAQDYVHQAIDFFYKKNTDQALKYLDRAIAASDTLDRPWNYKSFIFILRKQYDKALEAAEKALLRNPKYASAWNNKAAALIPSGRFDESLKAVDNALELRSTFDEAWYNKAIALHKRGENTEALRCLREAVRLDPTNRAFAMNDDDFGDFRNDPEFIRITAEVTGA